MGVITVSGIRVFAYHGCMAEERQIGSDYIVNVEVCADLSTSAKSDSLEDTVDYVSINQIVKQQMAISSNLLENVVEANIGLYCFKSSQCFESRCRSV